MLCRGTVAFKTSVWQLEYRHGKRDVSWDHSMLLHITFVSACLMKYLAQKVVTDGLGNYFNPLPRMWRCGWACFFYFHATAQNHEVSDKHTFNALAIGSVSAWSVINSNQAIQTENVRPSTINFILYKIKCCLLSHENLNVLLLNKGILLYVWDTQI